MGSNMNDYESALSKLHTESQMNENPLLGPFAAKGFALGTQAAKAGKAMATKAAGAAKSAKGFAKAPAVKSTEPLPATATKDPESPVVGGKMGQAAAQGARSGETAPVVAAAAKKSKTPGAGKTQGQVLKATASGTETEIPPTGNVPKKGAPAKKSAKPAPKKEPESRAPAGFATQKDIPPGFSSNKPKARTKGVQKPKVAPQGVEAPKTPGSPGAGAPVSAKAPEFSTTAQGELDSFKKWSKSASKSGKTAATYRRFQDKAKETKTDQSEFPINADKEDGSAEGGILGAAKGADTPEPLIGRLANHALRALLGPKSRRIARKFSRYMDKMNYPIGESSEIPMDATPRSPGSTGPSGDSPASDGRIQSEMVGDGVLPGSSGGGSAVSNVKEMDGDTSGVAFAGSHGEQFDPFSSHGGGTGAMEPGGHPNMKESVFNSLYEDPVDFNHVYEIRTEYNADGKDPTASEIMASPLPVSEEEEDV